MLDASDITRLRLGYLHLQPDEVRDPSAPASRLWMVSAYVVRHPFRQRRIAEKPQRQNVDARLDILRTMKCMAAQTRTCLAAGEFDELGRLRLAGYRSES